FGVATGAAPDETTSATALFGATDVPAPGDWLITLPDGTVELDAVVTAPTVSVALVIAAVAAAWVRPTTFGVATGAAPDETTSATTLFAATDVPATGDWLITLADVTMKLGAVVTAPTVSVALVIAADAAACVRPTTVGVGTA